MKLKTPLITYLLLIVLFAPQAVSAVASLSQLSVESDVPCSMDSTSHMTTMKSGTQYQADHAPEQSNETGHDCCDKAESMQCCDGECECMSFSGSNSYVIIEAMSESATKNATNIDSHACFITSSFISPLIRPPIRNS